MRMRRVGAADLAAATIFAAFPAFAAGRFAVGLFAAGRFVSTPLVAFDLRAPPPLALERVLEAAPRLRV